MVIIKIVNLIDRITIHLKLIVIMLACAQQLTKKREKISNLQIC